MKEVKRVMAEAIASIPFMRDYYAAEVAQVRGNALKNAEDRILDTVERMEITHHVTHCSDLSTINNFHVRATLNDSDAYEFDDVYLPEISLERFHKRLRDAIDNDSVHYSTRCELLEKLRRFHSYQEGHIKELLKRAEPEDLAQ